MVLDTQRETQMTTRYTFILVATNIYRQPGAEEYLEVDATKQAIVLQDTAKIKGYIDGDEDYPDEEGHDEVMNRNLDRFRHNANLIWGTDWYGFKVVSDIFPELEIYK